MLRIFGLTLLTSTVLVLSFKSHALAGNYAWSSIKTQTPISVNGIVITEYVIYADIDDLVNTLRLDMITVSNKHLTPCERAFGREVLKPDKVALIKCADMSMSWPSGLNFSGVHIYTTDLGAIGLLASRLAAPPPQPPGQGPPGTANESSPAVQSETDQQPCRVEELCMSREGSEEAAQSGVTASVKLNCGNVSVTVNTQGTLTLTGESGGLEVGLKALQ